VWRRSKIMMCFAGANQSFVKRHTIAFAGLVSVHLHDTTPPVEYRTRLVSGIASSLSIGESRETSEIRATTVIE